MEVGIGEEREGERGQGNEPDGWKGRGRRGEEEKIGEMKMKERNGKVSGKGKKKIGQKTREGGKERKWENVKEINSKLWKSREDT